MSDNKDQSPVIVLAFANEFTQERFLRKLTFELKMILNVLEPAMQRDRCYVKIMPAATQKEIASVFQDEWYEDRVGIFHYGGHGDEDELWLEDENGANKSFFSMGLAKFLGAQEGLKLVFLNACATHSHAQLLMDAGIQAVVATSQKIADDQATRFAEIFYQGLAGGANILESFSEAEGIMLGEWGPDSFGNGDQTRSLYWDTKEEESNGDFPWRLYIKEGSETFVNFWRLFYGLTEEQIEEDWNEEDWIGEQINNYEIIEYLGQGRFGIVYKALHTNLNKEVAIKISHKVDRGYEDLRNIIFSGNKGLSTLKHPNVVEFYDAGEKVLSSHKRIYVIMELVNGERLDRIDLGIPFLDKKGIKELIEIALQICAGLHAAHSVKFTDASGMPREGFVHGNLKPRKIIFTTSGVPKIIDFLFTDLARSHHIQMRVPDSVKQHARTDRLEDYYPPEVVDGSATLNKQTDIYSLGAIFFELIMSKKLSEIKFSTPEELHDLFKDRNGHIPRVLSQVIFKATHPRPNQRYQNMSEMIEDMMKSFSFIERLTLRLREKIADF